MPRLAATKGSLDLRGNQIWMPLVPIMITLGPRGTSGLALLDSGADTTIAPFEIVSPLGVDWSKLPKGSLGMGAGGTAFERRLCPATLSFNGLQVCADIEVAEPKKLAMVLLGRDFFAKFMVTFNWRTTPPTFDLEVPNRAQRRARR
jgi:hypothetical protein